MDYFVNGLKEAMELSVVGLNYRVLTTEESISILKACDALWLHSGNMCDPHAVTTKGQCTNGYIDTLRALSYTNLCELFAQSMVNKLALEYPHLRRSKRAISWVIGSDHAGAAFSHSVATRLGARHDFTEKGPDKTQRWNRFEIQPGETVLQVEELVTTLATLRAVREGILSGNSAPVNFLPIALTLVHRSDQYAFEGGPILYQVHFDIQTWSPEECPLCAAGSKRIEEPKRHWAELTGKM